MKVKLLLVVFLLVAEMVYMGRMVLHTEDHVVIETMLKIPGIGEWYYEFRIAETRAKAEAGDVDEMMALYFRAGSMDNVEDEQFALILLRDSGSAAAELFLFLEEGGEIAPGREPEYMLLVERAIQENVRPYLMHGIANAAYVRLSRQYAAALESLTVKTEVGGRDAKSILENLEQTQD